jgi:hypothetical protein
MSLRQCDVSGLWQLEEELYLAKMASHTDRLHGCNPGLQNLYMALHPSVLQRDPVKRVGIQRKATFDTVRRNLKKPNTDGRKILKWFVKN